MSRKDDLRDASRAHRASLMGTKAKTLIDDQVAFHAASFVESLPARSRPSYVAAYHPLPDEPGGGKFLPALAEAVGSGNVYLPVSRPDGSLLWGTLASGLKPGAFGIVEPLGTADDGLRDNSLLGECAAIFVPAMGVDRHGNRLGKGAGFYDRALAQEAAHCPLIAVVYDEEIYDTVPSESHDVPVQYALTPSGIVPFPDPWP